MAQLGNDPGPVAVLKCLDCGDVFPVHVKEAPACPSCGSRSLEVAGEPLL